MKQYLNFNKNWISVTEICLLEGRENYLHGPDGDSLLLITIELE